MSGNGQPIAAGIVAAAFLIAVSGTVMAGPRRGSNPATASASTADSGGRTAAPVDGASTGG